MAAAPVVSIEQAQAEIEKAEQNLQVAIAVAKSKQEILGSLQEESKNCRKEHQKAERAHKALTKKSHEFQKEQQQIQDAVEKLPAITDDDQAIADVERALEAVRAEKALVAAARGALGAKTRGFFDQETIEEIKQVFAVRLTDLEQALAESAPAEKEADSELLGLWALCEVCDEKVSKAQEDSTAAEESVKVIEAKISILQGHLVKCQKAAAKEQAAREAAEAAANEDVEMSEATEEKTQDVEMAEAPQEEKVPATNEALSAELQAANSLVGGA
eukprot:TRINITY_DN50944_c0_g1_i1.p1 TRINITY_DN50944_c0_g1~~TRINITY_DN50944_c0_g1_i1.p1  ORF type:complete len:274 (+),score=104.32 TRINITY_DN50944_c0_g1_i1:65-886(+)